MKILALFAFTFSVALATTETFPKMPVEIDGRRFFYADCLIVTTGMGGKHLHYVIVHSDEEQYADVVLSQSEKRPWPPRLSSATVDVPLTLHGVYLVQKSGTSLRVDFIAGDPPMTGDMMLVEAYIRESVAKQPLPLYQK